MKRIKITTLLLFLIMAASSAQSQSDTIVMKKVFGGYTFYQNDKRLTPGQLVKAMEPSPEAYKEMVAAQSNSTVASVFGGAGGFLIGWPIGTALGGGDPNWTLAGIGAGLVAISIPFTVKFNKQAKSAVTTFNKSRMVSGSTRVIDIKIGINNNGIGMAMRF